MCLWFYSCPLGGGNTQLCRLLKHERRRPCFHDSRHLLLFLRSCIAFITDAVRIRMWTVTQDKPTSPVDVMVMVALNYYAHGASSVAVLQRLGSSLAESSPTIIGTISGVIAGMADQFISFPLTRDAKASVASRIKKVCGIPDVLGVLAPAHFKIRASPYEKNTFRSFVNTLGYTSIVSQIICDSDGNILSLEKCCTFYHKGLTDAELVVLHPSLKHVLTPVSEPENDSETRFNEAHAKIQDVMRTTLGSLKRRFRCLMQLGFAQETSLDKKSNIIKACCVLHNIAKKFSVPPPPAAGKIEPLHPGKQHSASEKIDPEALTARQKLISNNFTLVSSSQDPSGNNVTEEDRG
uniref:Si:dkey-197c15.6 n=1 Tax=Lates calcarifer TaxID=8187 RepID=A0A4W6EQB9_LATCA